MIHITPEVRDHIVAYALRQRPLEACGMVSSDGASAAAGTHLVDAFHPLPNAAASATKFVIDPASMLALERTLESAQRTIVGIVHSHPASSPYPSTTDIADSTAYDPDGTYVQLLVSLRQAEPSLRAYRIVDGTVTELAVTVFEPSPTAHDQAGAVAKVARLPRPSGEAPAD